MQQHDDNPMEKADIASCLSGFVPDTGHIWFALVSRAWRRSWGKGRPKKTRAITPSTTPLQLCESFSLGLLPTVKVCNAAATIGSLHLLDMACFHFCPIDASTFMAAALGGQLDVLRWLNYNAETKRTNPLVCGFAAKGGSLACLKFLRSVGFAWDVTTVAFAAKGGFDDVLRWALENECVTRDEGLSHVLLNAAKGGHVRTLEWVVPYSGYEVYMNDVIVRGAVTGGRVCVLDYVLSVAWGVEFDHLFWDTAMWCDAAFAGNIDVLQWGWVNSRKPMIPFVAGTIVASWAAMGGSADSLRWLVERGFAVDVQTWAMGKRGGSEAVTEFLRSIRCPGSV